MNHLLFSWSIGDKSFHVQVGLS